MWRVEGGGWRGRLLPRGISSHPTHLNSSPSSPTQPIPSHPIPSHPTPSHSDLTHPTPRCPTLSYYLLPTSYYLLLTTYYLLRITGSSGQLSVQLSWSLSPCSQHKPSSSHSPFPPHPPLTCHGLSLMCHAGASQMESTHPARCCEGSEQRRWWCQFEML